MNIFHLRDSQLRQQPIRLNLNGWAKAAAGATSQHQPVAA